MNETPQEIKDEILLITGGIAKLQARGLEESPQMIRMRMRLHELLDLALDRSPSR